METVITYKLFNIGKIVFFKILEQHPYLYMTEAEKGHRSWTEEVIDIKDVRYIVRSDGCPTIDHFENNTIYVRGDMPSYNNHVSNLKFKSEREAITALCIINHLIHSYSFRRFLKNSPLKACEIDFDIDECNHIRTLSI